MKNLIITFGLLALTSNLCAGKEHNIKKIESFAYPFSLSFGYYAMKGHFECPPHAKMPKKIFLKWIKPTGAGALTGFAALAGIDIYDKFHRKFIVQKNKNENK